MDIPSLLEKFLQSPHGQGATSALVAQGFGQDDIRQILTHSVTAGAAHVEQAHTDNPSTPAQHTGLSFFAAFASGLVKGDGVMGSLKDGAAGVIQGHIAALLMNNMAMNSPAATAAAAATAPYVLAFLKEHLGI